MIAARSNKFLYVLLLLFVCSNALATGSGNRHRNNEFVNGDARPDAPALAYRGDYRIGVKTLKLVNEDQLDILNYSADNPNPRYDRPLTVEVWYPAKVRNKRREKTRYKDYLGTGPGNPDRPVTPFRFSGRAARNARPFTDDGPFPLVIVSHGYPGSRYLLSYLTENIASKGYVVVAIDHTESTHRDKVGFSSTMMNRPSDINFVLDTIARKGSYHHRGFLRGMVDAEQTALVGYSMGGYGSLVAAGAGMTPFATSLDFLAPGGNLSVYQAGTPDYSEILDERIKATVLFAPFGGSIGGQFSLWDEQGLKGLTVPSLWIVGNMDRTAPYAGVQYLFDNAISSDRYLLIYQSGIHEVAVNPTPPEAYSNYAEYLHYQEPAWDNRRLNNINQHFVTAFLGKHFKTDSTDYSSYLDLIEPIANNSPRVDDGTDPTFWKGFTDYTAVGMELYHVPAQ